MNYENLDFGASGPALRLYIAKNKSIHETYSKIAKQIKYEKSNI